MFVMTSVTAQDSKGYEVTGHIKGLKEGEKVTMCLASTVPGKVSLRRDSGYVRNGEFRVKGIVPEGTHLYWVELGHEHGSYAGVILHQGFRLFIDNSEHISITGDNDVTNIGHDILDHYVTVDGSPTNRAWQLISQQYLFYVQNVVRLKGDLRKIRDSLGFDKPLIDGIMMAKNDVDNALYATYLRDPEPDLMEVIPTLEWSYFQETDHSSIWVDVYSKLDDLAKTSYYGRRLKGFLSLCVGQPLPLFVFPDSTGKQLGLKDLTAKSKVTLVHFWATNSVIGDEYDRDLRAMYQKYHANGLNIIGVSTDDYKEEWMETLQSQKYPWYNVLDLKGKMVDTVYHELGSPRAHNTTNVLLDAQGRIIAWDPMGVELEWFLENYLNDPARVATQSANKPNSN